MSPVREDSVGKKKSRVHHHHHHACSTNMFYRAVVFLVQVFVHAGPRKKYRGPSRMILAFSSFRVDSCLWTEPRTELGRLLYSSPLYTFSRLISISPKHPEEASKGTMSNANSQLGTITVCRIFPNQVSHRLYALGKLSDKVHIEGNKRNKR